MAVDCKTFIKEAHGLSDQDAREIVDGIQAIMRERSAESRLSGFIKRAAQEEGDFARLAAANEKMNVQRNIIRQAEAEGFIFGSGDPETNLSAFLVGRPGQGIDGGLKSVDADMKAAASTAMGRLAVEMEANGHEGIWRMIDNRPFNRDVAREMWNLSGRSVTGNEDAFHVAQVFDRFKEEFRLRANAEGANIRHLPGHVFAQHHDARKALKAGFEGWRDFVLPKLDRERTFGTTGDPEEFLLEAWRSITSGRRRLSAETGRGGGPAALSKKLSRSRSLHFRDADAWLDYNAQYGDRDVMRGVLNGLWRLSEDVALMTRMGSNPEQMFKVLLRKVADVKRLEGLEPKEAPLVNQFRAISEAPVVAGDANLARTVEYIKAGQNASKLGSATITSFSDLNTFIATAQYQGVHFLTATAKGLKSAMKGRRRGEQQEALRLMGVGLEGMLGRMAARFTATDLGVGFASRLNNAIFKWNGLAWWTDTFKEGFALTSAAHLGDNLSFEWSKVNQKLRNVLGQYGIREEDWIKLREAGADNVDDILMVTPQTAERVGDMDLASKLRMFFVNEADFAVPTPGARERAIAMQGSSRGTVPNAVFQLFWQFKMFPLTIMTRHFPRLREQGIPATLQFALMGTLIGYAAMSVTDMLRGRLPRPVDDPGTYVAAMLKGGGAGLLGDVIFHDFRQYGQSLLQVAAGPTFGLANDIAKVTSAALLGDSGASQATQLLMRQVPFVNLFYTRTAIDYLMLYQVQEILNPGYLKRMERRVGKRTNQKFWLKPSEVVRRGGGFR
ncbi:MAG: hypothetical protein V3W44_08575 [Dehalococcoidales bacterium]